MSSRSLLWNLPKAIAAPIFGLVLAMSAAMANAATTSVAIGFDIDNNATTGCTLTVGGSSMPGVEIALFTVVTTTASTGTVGATTRRTCTAGVFGAPVVVSSGGWPVGMTIGLNGSDLIETFIPLANLGTTGAIKMGALTASDSLIAAQEFLLTPPPQPTTVTPIPTLSPVGLLFLMLLLSSTVWLMRRYARHSGHLLLALCVVASALTTVSALAIVMDGNGSDWTGIAPLATGAKGDAPAGQDLVALYAVKDGANLALRVDMVLERELVNQAPVVNAGVNQTVTLPASATLSGNATDDGLPNPPAALTYAWTKVSGPGGVTFGNATNKASSASFSVAGTYVLRLTANDGALSGSADVTITVNPAMAGNQPPVVNAGVNQTITLPAAAALNGTATDDGLPNPPAHLTTTWSFVSGPASGVVFGNPASLSTSATFAAPGTYTLRLTVSDGALSASSDMQVTVSDGAPIFLAVADRTIALGTRYQQLLVARDANVGDTLSYSLLTAPAGAALSPSPLVDWTPTSAQLGTHTFTATVTDAASHTAQTTFHVTVVHTNQPPQLALQVNVILPLGTAFNRTLQATDPDAGDTLTFALVSGPPGMSLTGAVLNWPTNGKVPGDYAVTVRVTDAASLFDERTFTVTLTQAAPAPVAKDDNYEVRLGETLTVPAVGVPGVLGNDLSLRGSPLTVVKLSDPTKGTLNAFNPDGGFTYTAPTVLPPVPGLNPVVTWRLELGSNTQFALAADFNQDGVVDYVLSDFGDLRAWRGSDGAQLWHWDRSITTHADISGCGTASDQFALGNVTDVVGGDIYLFSAINCDNLGHAGFPDRYYAVNASQILPGGKVATQWKSARLSKPHPGAYATNASPTLPDPPVTPVLAASANGSVPTLAKLTAGGSTKLVTRFLAASTYGYYYDQPNSGHLAYAACRMVTGLPADEGLACKATFVIDAATGAIEHVLTAPNPANEYVAPRNSPTDQNIPIIADLDGDGQVEIISGGDVWKLAGGVWALAWQAQFDAYTGPKKSFEPSSVAVADLDGDGKAEVVFHLLANSYQAGGVYIFNHAGSLLRKIPISTNVSGLLSVADVDGDGAPEILVAGDSFLYAYRSDGALLWAKRLPDILAGVVPPIAGGGTEPMTSDSQLYVYDLDLDGVPEVIVQGTRRLFILNGRTGAELWSIDTENDGFFQPGNPLLVDADGDGHVDIIVHVNERWNCPFFGSGPGGCKGNAMMISGGDHNWAPGPKVQNQLNFRPAAVDAGARILYDGSVRRDFRQQIQQGAVVDPRIAQGTVFSYKANDGAADSAPATVLIDIKPQNRPPVITSTPPTGLLSVTPYTRRVYTITATDPDPGDTVHYEFVSSTFDTTYFPAPVVDPTTGGVDIYSGPCGSYGGACDFGRVLVIVAAVDSHGARTEQSFFIDITYVSVAVPNVIGQSLSNARAAIEAASLTPLVVTEVFASQPVGTVIGQDPLVGTANVSRSAAVNLTVSKGPEPFTMPFVVGGQLAPTNALLTSAGLSINLSSVTSTTIPAGEIMTQTPVAGTLLQPASAPPVALTVSAGGPLPMPIASIVLEPGPGPLLRLAGDQLQYKAVAILTDGTSADVTVNAVWSSSLTAVATVDSVGVTKAIASGATLISASLGGKTGQGSLNVGARVLGDNTPPLAAITAPADGGAVIGPTSIVGTASDTNFLRYELAYAIAGNENYRLIAEGTTAVTGGTLGTLDPTTLVNDQYTLRLKVFDKSENQSVATRTVQVKGNRKIGLFSLTYHDLNLPAAGIPLTISRTYDSRDKTLGDFGIGWRLGLKTLQLRTNRVLGTGWLRTVSGALVSLAPTSEHKVSITLPDGRVEEFDMIVSPTSNIGSLDFTNVTSFQPRSGTLGQLQALANNSLLIVNGGAQDELVDDSTLNTYDPLLYRYTSVNGTQIDINRNAGVQKITDRNGNTVTFGPNGIVSSSGKNVLFARDSHGRVTQITDAAGNVQTYAYNGNSDLVSHTSATGLTSHYAYDYQHNLIDIQDPAGHHPARNTYDSSGHLISTIDANGNNITLANNLATSTQVITDQLGNPTIYGYDAMGNVTSKTDALGNARSYTYDSRNNQLTQTDPLGRVASKTYDSNNNILTSTDFDGNTTTSTYNAFGQVLTRIDPEGFTTAKVYDGAGNLTQVTDPEGGITLHTYDGVGNVLTTTDPLGHVTTFAYDGSGNRTSITDPMGKSTTFTYDSNGHQLSQTDANGKTSTYVSDANGHPIANTDPLGNTTMAAYSNVGLGDKLSAITGATGQVTRFFYDAVGNQTTATFADGSVAAVAYDVANRTTSDADRDGRATQLAYDSVGRATTMTLPGGSTKQTTYDAAGRPIKQTDQRGNAASIAYAPSQQAVTDALGNVVVNVFDSKRHLLKTTNALGNVTRFSYDSVGNLLQTTFPDGTTKTTTYDAAKRRITEIDQAGKTTQFAYDAVGNLIRVTDALGGITAYTYDAVGNRLTQTDANGHTTRMTYDAMHRVLIRIRPSGTQESFIYDALGNLMSHTDFNGQMTTFEYDTFKRLTTKHLPGGVTASYAYTSAGLRTQAGDDSYVYDVGGRVTQEHKASGQTLTYGYDAAGNRTSLTTPQGTTTYTYDALNRLKTVADAAGITTYAYDAVGRKASTVYPNGVTTTYGYDTLDRLVQVTNTGPGGPISSYTYTLGPAGNRTQVVEAGSATANRTVTYSFDALRRLTQEQIVSPGPVTTTSTYSLDGVGNRTQMISAGVTTTYAYDANDQLISQTTGGITTLSTFDSNGNLVGSNGAGVTNIYGYDAENRLVSASVPAGSFNYAYDADGMRVGRSSGSVTTNFLLDKNRDFAQVQAETTGADTITYTYGDSLINQQHSGTGTRFYLADGQRSTRQLTTTLGAVSDTYTFDAFGVPLAAAGATANPYRYVGEQQDTDTGLYYLRARYINPNTGRFLTTDPASGNPWQPMSLHRYVYANADPVNWRDPSGREGLTEISIAAAIGAGIGAATGVVGVGAKWLAGGTVTCLDFETAILYGSFFGAVSGGLGGAAGVAAGGITSSGEVFASGFLTQNLVGFLSSVGLNVGYTWLTAATSGDEVAGYSNAAASSIIGTNNWFIFAAQVFFAGLTSYAGGSSDVHASPNQKAENEKKKQKAYTAPVPGVCNAIGTAMSNYEKATMSDYGKYDLPPAPSGLN